jgi:hypothetical protein
MGAAVFVDRLRITNTGGVFDSLSPNGLEQPRIRFDAVKSLSGGPNRAKIEIYNLAPDTVAKICGTVRTRVEWTPAEREQLLRRWRRHQFARR